MPPLLKQNKMAVKKKADKKEETIQDENIFNEESSNQEEDDRVEVEVEDVTEKEPVMSISDVQELLEKQEEKWNQKLNKFAQKLRLGKAKGELQEEADYIEDLEDDWLDAPATFFAYSINMSIHGDKKRGVQSEPPQGPIQFKPIVRQKRAGRKGEEVISVSSVKVHSRAVANWLRNHSRFGISFFEDMDAVLNMNTGWAQKLVEANTAINSLSDQQVIARCKQFKLPVGTNIVQMRKGLVEHMAEMSVKAHDKAMYGKLKEAVIDKEQRQVVERKINV
jgi:hypothetical protein